MKNHSMMLPLSITIAAPVLEIVALAWSCFGMWAISDSSSQLAGLALLSGISAVFYYVCVRACTRMSMVAARFSLDSLPMKQLATESQFQSGQIDAATKDSKNHALLASVDRMGILDGLSRLYRTIMHFVLPLPLLVSLVLAIVRMLMFGNQLSVAFSYVPDSIIIIGYIFLAVYGLMCLYLRKAVKTTSGFTIQPKMVNT